MRTLKTQGPNAAVRRSGRRGRRGGRTPGTPVRGNPHSRVLECLPPGLTPSCPWVGVSGTPPQGRAERGREHRPAELLSCPRYGSPDISRPVAPRAAPDTASRCTRRGTALGERRGGQTFPWTRRVAPGGLRDPAGGGQASVMDSGGCPRPAAGSGRLKAARRSDTPGSRRPGLAGVGQAVVKRA